MKKKKENEQKAERKYVWMSEKEAAEYIGVSVRTMQRWRKDGCIVSQHGIEPAPPYYRKGTMIRYERSELEQWMIDGRSVSAAA